MKAAVFFGRKDVRVIEIDEPKIEKANDIKIKVKYCGICGSDMEEYIDGPIIIPTQLHPLTKRKLPLIMGHEFTGEIVETGEDTSDLKIGDNVVVNPVISCGDCYWCKSDTTCLCENMACMGLGTDGAFAEYIVVPSNNCYKIPKGGSLEKLVLTEPAAVAVRSVQKANVSEGDSILIIGAGTIGLLTIQIAKIAGAEKIIVTEIDSGRIALAKKLGATNVLNPNRDDIEKEIINITDGNGIGKIIVTVGSKDMPGFASALSIKRGMVILVGISPQPCPINTNDIVLSEKVIMGSHGYDKDDFIKAIQLITNDKIATNDFITKKIRLKQIVKNGFEELVNIESKNIKIVIDLKEID